MSRPRFFLPALDPAARDATLSEDESHHLARVMRLGVGDEVAVFDGRGHEVLARVERVSPKAATVSIVGPLAPPPPPRIPIVLVQALLKGDKMDDVVRDATMAGVSAIVPVATERSLVNLSTLGRGRAIERWQRVAIASAKQCGRAHLPVIHPPSNFAGWLTASFDGQRLLFVEPSPDGSRHSGPSSLQQQMASLADGGWRSSAGDPASAVACIVGPEGGWTAAERDAATAAGCAPVTLGSMTLRADAAGLVAVSIVSFLLENQ